MSCLSSLELDEEQREVVDYDDSCVVIAGPGSGKTRTLVAKAEKLYSEDRDLICLTFTRSAAKEMRDRMPGIRAQTIHSYCYDVLGWVGDYDKLIGDYLMGEGYREKYNWVLVDEIQDLNEYEFLVVESLIGNKVFAVGDPKQSIYGFNEALGEGIFGRFSKLGCRSMKLHNNYRSCSEIVFRLNRIYRRDLVSRSVKNNGLTAILTRTNEQVRRICRALKEHGIGFTVRFGGNEFSSKIEKFYGSDKLRVMTCHCSKGLEFDKVILYDWFPEPYWGEELNLYYVSIARASREFVEVSCEYELIREVKNGAV